MAEAAKAIDDDDDDNYERSLFYLFLRLRSSLGLFFFTPSMKNENGKRGLSTFDKSFKPYRETKAFVDTSTTTVWITDDIRR